jgi:hypothetical protein
MFDLPADKPASQLSQRWLQAWRVIGSRWRGCEAQAHTHHSKQGVLCRLVSACVDLPQAACCAHASQTLLIDAGWMPCAVTVPCMLPHLCAVGL